MWICAVCAVVGFGEQAGSPIIAGLLSEAAPMIGEVGEVFQVAVAVQHVENGREDVEQGFKKLLIRQQRLPIPWMP